MFVVKRDGTKCAMQFDKITRRLERIMEEFDIHGVDPVEITQMLVQRMVSGISTSELDELACQILMGRSHESQSFGELASKLAVSNMHKTTKRSFREVVDILFNNKDELGEKAPLISDDVREMSIRYEKEIEEIIVDSRDYLFDYFGLSTLKKAYLLRVGGLIVERPQHLFMRVSLGVNGSVESPDWGMIKRTYDGLSLKKFMHATPTLFHGGTCRQQNSSCFLLGVEDSIEGIFDSLKTCAQISKWAGGIGVYLHDVRSEGSYIRKTAGKSEGLMPLLKVFNDTARYVNQAGRRMGSFAMYLEPWHGDILKFLHAKRAQGVEEERARDLFYALWVPDLFMERVRDDKSWSLMCPDKCPGLSDVYGEQFKELYERYEREGKAKEEMRARDLWEHIVTCQIESGVPYMCYKDASNKKSNQKNLGTIKSSNLCSEIIEYSTEEEPAVCNLASISLSAMLRDPQVSFSGLSVVTKEGCFYCKVLKIYLDRRGVEYEEVILGESESTRYKSLKEECEIGSYSTVPQVFGSVNGGERSFLGGFWDMWEYLRPEIDYEELRRVAGHLTYNLNNIIDRNFYPVEGSRVSNMKHRPIGLGVQGLADVFAEMLVSFDSDYAKEVNKKIFETIYFGAMEESVRLAEEEGVYPSYNDNGGCPLSHGKFQFDLWGLSESDLLMDWDWRGLRERVLRSGARNSLLTALMPTASTAQIAGNNECFEPFTSNMYTRSTLAGEFTVVNKTLYRMLEEAGMWTEDLRNRMIYHRGSVQEIREIPREIREVFKTVWEISQKKYIDMSADRGPFICQSQSLNLWFAKPTFQGLYKAHFHAWSLGLKTGSYYVRQLPSGSASRLGMSGRVEKELEKEVCESCSA